MATVQHYLYPQRAETNTHRSSKPIDVNFLNCRIHSTVILYNWERRSVVAPSPRRSSQTAINITDSYQNQHSYDSSFYEQHYQQQYDHQGLSHSSFEEKIVLLLIQAFSSFLEEKLQSAISSLTGQLRDVTNQITDFQLKDLPIKSLVGYLFLYTVNSLLIKTKTSLYIHVN
ncbi:hypothetical protein GHT06_009018 [Daphnia sinensis]|uniref:Uncharacterized protein n=1 Tax=Daphnia sinensis TaxID=1820382 RepID=A0AAD5LND0_9CRUS|nr:hypothetical protein GHT06_009018 [Daphnia sinensis]